MTDHGPERHQALEVHVEHVAEVGLNDFGEVPDHHGLEQNHGVQPQEHVQHKLLVPGVLLCHRYLP